MIIIEGADNTGKTRLAVALASAMGLERHHMTRPADDFDHVGGYMRLVGPHVQDRFHLGAVVYGRMLDAGGSPSAQQMQIVQRYLRWQGCVTVVLHCQRAVLAERLRAAGREEMYRQDEILMANDGYRALLGCSNRGVPWHDVAIDVTDRWPDIDDGPVQQIIEGWRARWLR